MPLEDGQYDMTEGQQKRAHQRGGPLGTGARRAGCTNTALYIQVLILALALSNTRLLIREKVDVLRVVKDTISRIAGDLVENANFNKAFD